MIILTISSVRKHRTDQTGLCNIFFLSLAKKKESYRSLLDEYKELPLDATFKDIKKKIVEDPRYNKFSSSDKKCEKEFNSWVSLLNISIKFPNSYF